MTNDESEFIIEREKTHVALLSEIKAIAETLKHPKTLRNAETCDWASKALLELIPKYQ